MSIHLALAAAGLLAGAAHIRKGSRSKESDVQVKISSPEEFLRVLDKGDRKTPLMKIFINDKIDSTVPYAESLMYKKDKEVPEKLYEHYIEKFQGYIDTYSHRHGVDKGKMMALEKILSDFMFAKEYIEKLTFPLQVYRGIRVTDLLHVDEDTGSIGEHWTSNREIAEQFAKGTHFAATRLGEPAYGIVFEGVIKDPKDVDWPSVIELYIMYSANPFSVPPTKSVEMQINVINPQSIDYIGKKVI